MRASRAAEIAILVGIAGVLSAHNLYNIQCALDVYRAMGARERPTHASRLEWFGPLCGLPHWDVSVVVLVSPLVRGGAPGEGRH